MPYQFRHSICNEVFENWAFADTCKAIRKAGYSGIEIAPFTLSDDPGAIPDGKRREYRSIIEAEGLQFAGLHWLLVAPKGLHVTTPDKTLRERSWEYVRKLVDLCADLGQGGIMVFGSPKQRSTKNSLSPEQATRHFIDGLAAVAPHAAERRVTVLVEALPKRDCDVVNTVSEAVTIVREIDSPGVRTMFDTHNAIDETDPHDSIVEEYFDFIRHVHINEMDGRHPGTGNYDFKPLLNVLRRRNYSGWVSLEVFDFKLGAETIAQDSIQFINAETAKLNHE
jgi:D-psicose/D-tagatose/L-ribulose 3-epimerase